MMSGLASFASCVESNTDNTLMIYLPVITNILFSFKYLLLFSPKAPKEIFSITIFLASFTQAYSGGINYKTLHFSNKRHSCENPTIKTLVSSEYNCSMTMFNPWEYWEYIVTEARLQFESKNRIQWPMTSLNPEKVSRFGIQHANTIMETKSVLCVSCYQMKKEKQVTIKKAGEASKFIYCFGNLLAI